MKKETYVKCMDFIRSTPSGVVIVNNLGKLFTFITAACYLFITAGCIWGRLWQELIIYLAIPGISFVAVSIFRKCYNAKRPYEIYEFKPLIPKDTIGKSFPSRHVFSIFVIGTTLLYQYTFTGVLILYMGCLLAAIRVITGVHFPKDVIVGGLIGILCGAFANILFWLL